MVQSLQFLTYQPHMQSSPHPPACSCLQVNSPSCPQSPPCVAAKASAVFGEAVTLVAERAATERGQPPPVPAEPARLAQPAAQPAGLPAGLPAGWLVPAAGRRCQHGTKQEAASAATCQPRINYQGINPQGTQSRFSTVTNAVKRLPHAVVAGVTAGAPMKPPQRQGLGSPGTTSQRQRPPQGWPPGRSKQRAAQGQRAYPEYRRWTCTAANVFETRFETMYPTRWQWIWCSCRTASLAAHGECRRSRRTTGGMHGPVYGCPVMNGCWLACTGVQRVLGSKSSTPRKKSTKHRRMVKSASFRVGGLPAAPPPPGVPVPGY